MGRVSKERQGDDMANVDDGARFVAQADPAPAQQPVFIGEQQDIEHFAEFNAVHIPDLQQVVIDLLRGRNPGPQGDICRGSVPEADFGQAWLVNPVFIGMFHCFWDLGEGKRKGAEAPFPR